MALAGWRGSNGRRVGRVACGATIEVSALLERPVSVFDGNTVSSLRRFGVEPKRVWRGVSLPTALQTSRGWSATKKSGSLAGGNPLRSLIQRSLRGSAEEAGDRRR